MIQVAIWGAGAIARVHADAFLEASALCHISAVCNRHVEKAQQLIEEKGLSAVACADLRQAMEQTQVDAVAICLPPAQHAEAAVWAAEHGVHILLEKPMAGSLEECDAIISAARKTGVMLAVVCQRRFSTDVQRLRRLLEDETFGKLRYVEVNSLWWRGARYHDVAWRGTWASEGGGVLTSQALHHLDLLLYLAGMPERVTAVMDNVGHPNTECEDVLTAVLEYPGMFAQLSASLVAHGERQTLDFYTERGCLSLPWRPLAAKARPNGFPDPDPDTEAAMDGAYAAIPPLAVEKHPAQVLDFLQAIRDRCQPLAGGEDGRRVIEVITAIYESACRRQPVSLPLPREDDFYTLAGKAALLPHFHEKTVSLDSLPSAPITVC